ncbi:MAG: sigma 54-interacting transcriptional regulator [Planctomycetota bacterium]
MREPQRSTEEDPASGSAVVGGDRPATEKRTLADLGRIMSSTLELSDAFKAMMMAISDRLGLRRGTLVVLDEATGELRTEAAVGLSGDDIRKNRFSLGEGVTGNVVATGRPRIVPDIRNEPDFLNRTSRLNLNDVEGGSSDQVSFICVPIRVDDRPVGALAVDLSHRSDAELNDDAEFLEIVAALLAQAIQINRMVLRQKEELIEENQRLRHDLRGRFKFENVIGDSPAMNEVFATVGQVATSRATVLILGETGTGKEMIAKAIHYNSPRKEKPFIRVNCGALTGTLLESELFGHVKGSFTGAIRDKIGRFEAADGGTIFLDEIGTMEPQLQVKLLRVLQEREFERVGDTETVKVDVRVIAATNVDLQEEVAQENFREDLFYRLNVVSVFLPPLRNRREDIPALLDHFLERFNRENNRNLRRISRDLLTLLTRYPWPGNVRELENAVERAVVLSATDDFKEELLPLSVRMFAQQGRSAGGATSEATVDQLSRRLAEVAVSGTEADEGHIHSVAIDAVEGALIERALSKCGGVKTRAADFLGINRNTLNKKVKELGLQSDD